ncbi:hypothetical protein FOCC_FOCC011694, partial [Frankliniella occidentalis]
PPSDPPARALRAPSRAERCRGASRESSRGVCARGGAEPSRTASAVRARRACLLVSALRVVAGAPVRVSCHSGAVEHCAVAHMSWPPRLSEETFLSRKVESVSQSAQHSSLPVPLLDALGGRKSARVRSGQAATRRTASSATAWIECRGVFSSHPPKDMGPGMDTFKFYYLV